MEDTKVLAAYGRTMRFVQAFEGRLKVLLSLYRVRRGLAARPSGISDKEFEALLSEGEGCTAGQTLRDLFKELSGASIPVLPAVGVEGLWKTIELRNFLAHRYFKAYGVLVGDVLAGPYLTAQLGWFSEVFERWLPTLDKWANLLLGGLGISAAEILEVEQHVRELRNEFRAERLAMLKQELETMGIQLSPVPEAAAQQSDAADGAGEMERYL